MCSSETVHFTEVTGDGTCLHVLYMYIDSTTLAMIVYGLALHCHVYTCTCAYVHVHVDNWLYVL